MVQANPIGPITQGGITAQTRVNLKLQKPAQDRGNPKFTNVNNVHLCKDQETGETELASFNGDMVTNCTLSEHESIREYR